jgi:hypothetical protein
MIHGKLSETYTNILILLRIITTVPVSTAPAERNFSKLELINASDDTQNYWVCRLFSSPGILETRKHYVSESGPVSVLM